MTRISSRTTFYYKRVFPAVWFGFLVVFFAINLVTGARDPMLFIVPVGMTIFGFFLMKKLVFDLVDDVFDHGNALLIKNRGQEDRIALADIINVNYSPFMSPPRVTLMLRRPSVFGAQIAFCAPVRLMPLAASPVIEALIKRVDAARRAHH